MLSNPHILFRPFVQHEAVLSSKIEGTQATLGELPAAEAVATVDRSPEDLREVGNYVVALEHSISRLKKLPLCVRLSRELREKTHDRRPGASSCAQTVSEDSELDRQAWQHDRHCFVHPASSGAGSHVV